MILSDENLSKFMHIGDIMEAVSEILPVMILQFINNNISNSWWHKDGNLNIFVLLTFIGQAIHIFLSLVTLSTLLIDETNLIFWKTLFYLREKKSEQ